MYERILYLLEKNNMDKKELAELLNINQSTIYRWQQENRQPTTPQIIEMAKIFNTTTDFILLGINENGEKQEETIIKKYYESSEKEKRIIKMILEIDE